MAQIYLIWDHGNLTAWRQAGKSVKSLGSFEIANIDELVAFLDAHEGKWKISALTLYVDHTALDHHIQRVPILSQKLQRQLMLQRKEKLYGNVPRSWAAKPMQLLDKKTHNFYFVSSLPDALTEPLALWALRVGVLVKGVFSLPQALSIVEGGPSESGKSRIIARAFNQSVYLLAYTANGQFLFVNRVARAGSDLELIKEAAKRLALFTEQEFAETPNLELDEASFEPLLKDNSVEQDALIAAKLIQQKRNHSHDLVATKQAARLKRRNLRHRLFVFSILIFGVSFFFMLPQTKRKREVSLKMEVMQTEIQGEVIEKDLIQSNIINNKTLMHVIDFSRDRLKKPKEEAIPMALKVVIGTISHTLDDALELDILDCKLALDGKQIEVLITGRPLSADTDLIETLEAFEKALKVRGWDYTDWQIEFSRERQSESRFDRRGALRSFNLSFNLLPFAVK
jgi:hypothetical protein